MSLKPSLSFKLSCQKTLNSTQLPTPQISAQRWSVNAQTAHLLIQSQVSVSTTVLIIVIGQSAHVSTCAVTGVLPTFLGGQKSPLGSISVDGKLAIEVFEFPDDATVLLAFVSPDLNTQNCGYECAEELLSNIRSKRTVCLDSVEPTANSSLDPPQLFSVVSLNHLPESLLFDHHCTVLPPPLSITSMSASVLQRQHVTRMSDFEFAGAFLSLYRPHFEPESVQSFERFWLLAWPSIAPASAKSFVDAQFCTASNPICSLTGQRRLHAYTSLWERLCHELRLRKLPSGFSDALFV